MKLIVGFLLAMIFATDVPWHTDLEKAKAEAAISHKFILLNFSGSDWCGPCINMRRKLFENDAFKKYAESHLVLVNADFPRFARNQLPADVSAGNQKLLEKYNPSGKFPFTIIMDKNGKILKSFEGFPNITENDFIKEIRNAISNN